MKHQPFIFKSIAFCRFFPSGSRRRRIVIKTNAPQVKNHQFGN
jgi:hypothetical protein